MKLGHGATLLLVSTASVGALVFACSSTVNGTGPGSGSSSGSSGKAGATTEEITSCKQSCDRMKFFGCSTADDQAVCYGDCEGATSSQIEVFTGCTRNSTCDTGCQPQGGSSSGSSGTSGSSGSSGSSGTSGTSGSSGIEVTTCGYSCDQFTFFKCPGGDTTAKACKGRCAAATSEERTTFKNCVFDASNDCPTLDACWADFNVPK